MQKERTSIPEGLLEVLDWQDPRSLQIGLTLQGQKMLVIGGFPFVKTLVSFGNENDQLFQN